MYHVDFDKCLDALKCNLAKKEALFFTFFGGNPSGEHKMMTEGKKNIVKNLNSHIIAVVRQ